MSQLSLFDAPTEEKKTRRLRSKRGQAWGYARAQTHEPSTLFMDFRCGYCGTQTTLSGHAGLCEGCGAVLMRE